MRYAYDGHVDTRLGWDPSALIDRFSLDDQAAKDLRFLSSIAWVGRIQVSTVTSAPRSYGSSALVKAG